MLNEFLENGWIVDLENDTISIQEDGTLMFDIVHPHLDPSWCSLRFSVLLQDEDHSYSITVIFWDDITNQNNVIFRNTEFKDNKVSLSKIEKTIKDMLFVMED